MQLPFAYVTLIILTFINHDVLSFQTCNDIVNSQGTKSYVNQIFDKYANNTNLINNIQFVKLLKNIYLGSVFIECQPGDDQCEKDAVQNHVKGLQLSKDQKIYSENRSRRNAVGDDDEEHRKEKELHKKHWQEHLKKCVQANELLKSHQINNTSGITKYDFIRLCPSLLEQIDNKVCVHTHIKAIEHLHDTHGQPTTTEVWGYGMLSITLISLLSLSVISMIPCLKKSFYHKLMAYLVALAVGTLAGDAMLHLIPHAFAEGSNTAINLKVSPEEKAKQHNSQVYRALFVLLGIYLFFVVEQAMKIKERFYGGAGHGHSHGGHSSGHSHNSSGKHSPLLDKNSPRKSTDGTRSPNSPSDTSSGSMVTFLKETGSKKEGEEVEIKVITEPDEKNLSVEEDPPYYSDDRSHTHHHGEKDITKDTKISSVAWMVVVGDGFHNFSDGLAVGVAFSASLSSGVSTAIAVFCHELPHELGDFAILINSGMTIKQAIVYNLVSAILAYIGLAVGILIGESELGRHFVLSITAGLFLYVSLADMLPELTHQELPYQSQCSAFLCQHLGILSGIGMMALISFYEHSM